MTRAEKVAQMLSAHVHNDTSELIRLYNRTGWGVACLPPSQASHNATREDILAWRNNLQTTMVSQSRLGIPVSFRAELLHSGGVPGSVVFPMPCLIGASWNKTLARSIASAAATEARAGGVDYGFGPVLQVATDARWGRLCEAFGEDPALVTDLGLAAVAGYQGDGDEKHLASSASSANFAAHTHTAAPSRPISGINKLPMQAKHFAAYGALSHDTLAVNIRLDVLHDVYLRPWRAFITRGGARAVMVSHPPVQSVPAVANRWLLTTLLRQAWGGANVTVASDDGDVSRLVTGWGGSAANDAAAARLALLAGLDQELHSGADPSGLCFTTLASYEDKPINRQLSGNGGAVFGDRGSGGGGSGRGRGGLLSNHDKDLNQTFVSSVPPTSSSPFANIESEVNVALERGARNALRLKFTSGLFDRAAAAVARPFDRAAHRRLALDAARQGCVLLRNGNQHNRYHHHHHSTNSSNIKGSSRDMGTLPLRQPLSSLTHIAILGPNGDGLDAERAMVGGYAAHPAPGAVVTIAAAVRAEVLGSNPTTSARTAAAAAAAAASAASGGGAAAAAADVSTARKSTPTTKVTFVAGASICNSTQDAGAEADLARAVTAATASELALVVLGDSGGTECTTCGEGRDRTSLEMPGTQLILLRRILDKVNPRQTRVVVVLIHGRPITFGGSSLCARLYPCHNQLLDHPALSAVLTAWRPGEMGAAAVLDLITGRQPFVGKLTQAWPRSVGQIGAAGVGPWFGLPLRQGTDLNSDAYASGLKTPLFPFGYGLQPGASFEFLNMRVSAHTVVISSSSAAAAAEQSHGTPNASLDDPKHQFNQNYNSHGRNLPGTTPHPGSGSSSRTTTTTTPTTTATTNEIVNVAVDVRNTGIVRSAATVQLYYSPPPHSPYGVLRYARRLLAFERVWLAAGETKTALMSFNATEAFSRFDETAVVWDPSLRPGFVVDPGNYTLYAGDCCISGVVADTFGCVQPLKAMLAVYGGANKHWQ